MKRNREEDEDRTNKRRRLYKTSFYDIEISCRGDAITNNNIVRGPPITKKEYYANQNLSLWIAWNDQGVLNEFIGWDIPQKEVYAAKCGFKEYLAFRPLINDVNELFYTACKNGHAQVVSFLIEKGVRDYVTPFRNACRNGNMDVVQLLVDSFPMTTGHFEYGLALACKKGHMQVVRLMIQLGAVNWAEAWWISLSYGHSEIMQELERSGGYECFHHRS